VPTPPLTVVNPDPVPSIVILPALFTGFVENVMVPVVPSLLIVKSLGPVTPPLNVVEIAVPVVPINMIPELPDARTIGWVKFSPVVPTRKLALLLPLV